MTLATLYFLHIHLFQTAVSETLAQRVLSLLLLLQSDIRMAILLRKLIIFKIKYN